MKKSYLEEKEEEEEEETEDLEIRGQVTTGMREKGINMEWIDRDEWRSKMKLLAQKDVQTSILCTQIKIFHRSYAIILH